VIQEVIKLGQVITVLTLTPELEMTISWKAVTIDKPAAFLSCSLFLSTHFFAGGKNDLQCHR
jgi:hypothetical protein